LSTPTAIYPDLAGKVALVTGGTKGIGAETCRALVANGVRVAVNGRSAAGVDKVVAELGDATFGVVADCTKSGDVEAMRKSIEGAVGPIDLLATFAGGFESFTPIATMELGEWRQVIEDNLTSTFITVREFLPGMIQKRAGAIVTMASISGRYLDKPTQAAYAAAKAGVIMFTRHLALEVGHHGVRSNCVAPGTTRTERIERVMDEQAIESTAALSPLGRLGMPADTANATIFLLSESASWLTGVTLDVAGGRVML
jgi:NAD(P)-dependent dehydrogenase (short-subunit alcohol dehydrogenase family)